MSLSDKLKNPPLTQGERQAMVNSIVDMLHRKGIDVQDIGDLKRVSLYQTITKNDEGEAETHDLMAIQFSPTWESGPQWPVVQQGPNVKIPGLKKPRNIVKAGSKGWRKAVILPDAQIGFYKDASGKLQPTHDPKAIAVAMAIIEDVKPDVIVCVGDNLDLPEMGKYRLSPAYQQTTQASIDAATMFCASMRAASPNAKIVWLAGNHEERMPRYLLDNAAAAFGIRKGNTPESWPVMSIPYLCRMDEFFVEYRPGYPASDFWINEKIRVIHGDRVKSNGSTAHLYLSREKTSVIYGHIHRIETAYKTREDYDGPRTILAASPGTLARIDGAVPSTKGGVDLDGRPLVRHEDWQQGVGIVNFQTSEPHRFSYETVHIYDGWAVYNGKEYTG